MSVFSCGDIFICFSPNLIS